MAKAENEEEVSEDALLSEAGEVEASEDDLLREAQAASASASTGPTFYVRDDKGGFQPISKGVADQADALGLRVLSEAEVRGVRDAPQAPAEPKPPADPGFLNTVVHGLGQGYFKQGYDELAGALGRARDDTVGQGLRMPDGSVRLMKTSGDAYRVPRDREREIERGGREHHPFTAFLSNMAGDIASDAALNFMGVPVASTPYQVASGALSGLLGSDAELSTDDVKPGAVASAAGSTALGAGLGYVLPKVGTQVAKALPGAMARLRQGLESSALENVKKALTSGSKQLANKMPISDAAAREALDSAAVVPFGTTTGTFERLKALADQRGEVYADILARLEKAGVKGPEIEAIAQRLMAESEDRFKNSGANKAVANAFADEAANIRAIAPPEPNSFSLVGEGPMAVTGPRLAPEPRGTTPKPSAPAPSSGPVVSPPLGPLPVRAAPVWTPAATEATTAGRPRSMPSTPTPATAALPDNAPLVAPAARALGEAIPGPMASRLPLSQAERIKRVLQKEAKYGKIEDTLINEARQEMASIYREGIENAVEDAGKVANPSNELAVLTESFLPVKQQLARTLEAKKAAQAGAAKAAHRMSGGAADVNLFDVANASQATGAKGIPALALAMAGRLWKERRPSTLANAYDVGAEAAGNLSRAAYANPETTQALARIFSGPIGRQVAGSSTAEEALADYLMRRNAGAQP